MINEKTWSVFVVVVALLFVEQVAASPVIVTAEGLNHSENLWMVSTIPEKYLEYVDWIEFVEGPYEFMGRPAGGSIYAWWGQNHECYDVKIVVVVTDLGSTHFVLWHELGHAYEYCELKKDFSSEEYADNFVVLRP